MLGKVSCRRRWPYRAWMRGGTLGRGKAHHRQGGRSTWGRLVGSVLECIWARGEAWDSCLAFPSSDYYGRWWGLLEALKLRAELNFMEPLALQPRFQLCPSSAWGDNAQNLISPNNWLGFCEPNCHLPCSEFVVDPRLGWQVGCHTCWNCL